MKRIRAKAKAKAHASVKNLINIVLSDRKKKRRARRRTTTSKKHSQQQQAELIQSLASRGEMRPIVQVQPQQQDQTQNTLLKNALGSLASTNAGLLHLMNGMNTETTPPDFQELTNQPVDPPDTSLTPPDTPTFSAQRTPDSNHYDSILWENTDQQQPTQTPAKISDQQIDEMKYYLINHINDIPRKKTYTDYEIHALKNENHIKKLYRDTKKALNKKQD